MVLVLVLVLILRLTLAPEQGSCAAEVAAGRRVDLPPATTTYRFKFDARPDAPMWREA